MRVVALISGGKDSTYSMMLAVADGHDIVALANLRPRETDELDSYMYQTVGHQAIDAYAQALQVPLFRRWISGSPKVQTKDYSPIQDDEVEDLFHLLLDIRTRVDFDGVCVGAILSEYQTLRVLNVCQRLDIQALAYLWRRNQAELLEEMCQAGIEAILIKVASLGLDPHQHLGQTVSTLKDYLISLESKFGCNPCGEGGEYETLTLNCPLFTHELKIVESETVVVSDDGVVAVAYINPLKVILVAKSGVEASASQQTRIGAVLDTLRRALERRNAVEF